MQTNNGNITDQEAKLAILDIGRRMYKNDMVAGNDGNISCRVSDDVIWVTPTCVSKGFMTEDMLVKMRLDGEVLEGSLKPSSEIKMHIRAYRENPQIMAVTHAHPTFATSFAVAGIPIDKALMVESVLSLGTVPVVHFAMPGTEEVPDAVAPYFKKYNAVLLANHGALAWGDSLLQSYYRMEMLEHSAKITFITSMLGKCNILSEKQVEMLANQRIKFNITKMANSSASDKLGAPCRISRSRGRS